MRQRPLCGGGECGGHYHLTLRSERRDNLKACASRIGCISTHPPGAKTWGHRAPAKSPGSSARATPPRAILGGKDQPLADGTSSCKISIPHRLQPLLEARLDCLVILDEVHRLPRFFPLLRSLVDRARRRKRRAGLYLLLGFVSPEVPRQDGESLAGRAAYLELCPLETGGKPWRGSGSGAVFPRASWPSGRRRASAGGRTSSGPTPRGRLPAETVRHLLTMLATSRGSS